MYRLAKNRDAAFTLITPQQTADALIRRGMAEPYAPGMIGLRLTAAGEAYCRERDM